MPTKINKIRSFETFEDMENDQLSYFASLNPIQLLMNLKQLNDKAFGFNEKMQDKKAAKQIRFE